MAASELLRRSRLRSSLTEWAVLNGFEPAPHHQLLIRELEAVARGECDRLMVFMPPGSAKSTYSSTLFPPWFLAQDPSLSIIAASHTAELAEHFGRRVRNLVAEHTASLGYGLAADSHAAGRWETSKGGVYFAAGVRGPITGRRADLALIDDPVKSREEADSEAIRKKTWDWYKADLYTRLKPGARVVLIQTRWHEEDLGGQLLTDMERGGDQWRVVRLPALAEAGDPLGRALGEPLWPAWQDGQALSRIRSAIGHRDWSALYQQTPSPDEGNFFKREWLQYYDEVPRDLRFYGASDYAVTDGRGDYTVHGVIGLDAQDNVYLVDWWRGQTRTDQWIETLLDMMLRWAPVAWGEEAGQIIKSIGPFIDKRQRERQVYGFRVQYTSAVDKPTRARAIQARWSMGKVFLPRRAPWLSDIIAELMAFPAGKNDDQVDVMSLFGRMLADMRGQTPSPQPARQKWLHEMTYEEAFPLNKPKAQREWRV